MNVLKHMEAIFVVALVAIGTVSFVAQAKPYTAPQAQSFAAAATQPQMTVITITAKRLTPAEKQRLLLAERASGSRA